MLSKIQTSAILSGLAICFCLVDAKADVVATLTNNLFTSATTINAGDSFSVTLSLASTSENLVGLTYFLTVTPDSGSTKFSIIGRDTNSSSFSDLTTTNPSVLVAADALLDPQTNKDLGAGVQSGSVPAGTYFVADLSLLSSNTLDSGIYTISLSSNSVALDDGFNEIPISASYTINVVAVPEPTSYAMIGFGIVMAGGVFLKRKSYNF